MPVRKVGPNSYQWGTSGKVYTGKDAKAKAERQGRAIYASGYREAEGRYRVGVGQGGYSYTPLEEPCPLCGVNEENVLMVYRDDGTIEMACTRGDCDMKMVLFKPRPRSGLLGKLKNLFSAESYKPPASAVANAKRGLALRKEYGRGGLSPSEAKSQGIDSGVTRARKIASGKVSRHDVRRMSAFNRHRKNYRPEKKMPDGGPTAGTIAWLLWGGTSGVNWAKKKSAAMNAESEEFDAEDYNSFTEEMDSLIDKYGVLQHYETSYYDNLMDVSFSFRPHDPYFDDVDFDAEDESFEDFKRKMVGDGAVAGDMGYMEALEEYYQEYLDDYAGSNPESFEEFQERTLREDYESFEAEKPKNSRISPSAALAYLKSSPDACVWLLDWSTENYGDAGNPSYDYPVEDPDDLELMIIEGVFEGPDAPDIATDKYYRAENWGGDPEGPLAKALARAREKLSQPRKPLRITSLPHPDQKTLKDFESDNWKLLPRDRMGRWRKPVDSESIKHLTESLSSDVPSISELLTMYGGDTPTNRFRLYQDLQTLSIAQMDAALPDDSIVEFDEADLSWMTPEEYYQYVLEEPLNISDDIEDDTQTVEFQDRLVRYTAMTMTPTEVDDLLEQNLKDVVADLFAPDSEDTEAEIAFLLAVKRYQEFSDRYAAE